MMSDSFGTVLRSPLAWKKPRRVFVNSMGDMFHPKVPYEFINAAFSVMEQAARERGHVFQVLTKRPGRAVAWWKQNEQGFPAWLASQRLDWHVSGESKVRAEDYSPIAGSLLPRDSFPLNSPWPRGPEPLAGFGSNTVANRGWGERAAS